MVFGKSEIGGDSGAADQGSSLRVQVQEFRMAVGRDACGIGGDSRPGNPRAGNWGRLAGMSWRTGVESHCAAVVAGAMGFGMDQGNGGCEDCTQWRVRKGPSLWGLELLAAVHWEGS